MRSPLAALTDLRDFVSSMVTHGPRTKEWDLAIGAVASLIVANDEATTEVAELRAELTEAKLLALRFEERVREVSESGCTTDLVEWSRADLREALSCTAADRCSACRCRAMLEMEWDPAKHGKSLSDRLARALGASTDVSVPLPHLPLRVDRRDVEIDSLRAEVARLTSELDHARADIAAWEAACAKERATTDERTAELLAVTLELAELLAI